MVFPLGRRLDGVGRLTYFAMYILEPDVANANTLGRRQRQPLAGAARLVIVSRRAFVIEFLIIKKVPAMTKDGRVFTMVMIVLVVIVIVLG